MSIPHDYYHGHGPELRSMGNSRHYVEPDYIANDCDDQLPLLSTVGRGPRGHGVKPVVVSKQPGKFEFAIVDDVTGQTVWQSGNIAGDVIDSIRNIPDDNPEAGGYASVDVHVTGATGSRTYTITLPPGAAGSRIYVCEEVKQRTTDGTYRFADAELLIYGYGSWADKPYPRTSDIVFFRVDDGHTLALGTVEAVDKGQVVVTSRVDLDVLSQLSIGSNGHWYINGVDTGQVARGAKGDKGDPGKDGIDGLPGADGESASLMVEQADGYALLTAVDYHGTSTAKVYDGEDGEDGRDATIKKVSVKAGEPGSEAEVTVTPYPADNSYDISFVIPRGEDGRSLDVQTGWYTVDQLPDYDDTPINTAFIVDDGDGMRDMYIRGREPVAAEQGGPWTVIDNFCAFSPIVEIEQDGQDYTVTITDKDGEKSFTITEPTANVTKVGGTATITLTDHNGTHTAQVSDGLTPHIGENGHWYIGDEDTGVSAVGQAIIEDGSVTEEKLSEDVKEKLNAVPSWDEVTGKPDNLLVGTVNSNFGLVLKHDDGNIENFLQTSQAHDDVTSFRPGGFYEDSISGTFLYIDCDATQFKSVPSTTGNQMIALSDAVTAQLAKADTAIQESDLTAAIAAEADAREKADQLLETEIEGKLDSADIAAGDGVSVSSDPETGRVTISAEGKAYTAGDGIDISDANVVSVKANKKSMAISNVSKSDDGSFLEVVHWHEADDTGLSSHQLYFNGYMFNGEKIGTRIALAYASDSDFNDYMGF